MLKARCVKCGAVIDAPNSASGRNLACECGEIYLIPETPKNGDVRVCLNCRSISTANSYECPNCRWNFRLNRIEEYEHFNPSFWQRVRPALTKTVAILLAAAAAWWIYSCVTAGAIGVSAKTPLGVIRDGKYNAAEFIIASENGRNKHYRAKPKDDSPGEPLEIIAEDNGRILEIRGSYMVMIIGSSYGKGFYDRLRRELKVPEKLISTTAGSGRGNIRLEMQYSGNGYDFKETKDATPSPAVKDNGEYVFSVNER